MFKRYRPVCRTAAKNVRNAAKYLTTDDILARMARKTRLPWGRVVMWVGLLLGSAGVVASYLIVFQKKPDDVFDRPADAQTKKQPIDMAPGPPRKKSDAGAAALTQVSIELSHIGSVFVDGRYVGRKKHLQAHLRCGEHVLRVHFEKRSVTQLLRVQDAPLFIRCTRQDGCGPAKTHAGH